MHFYSCKCLYSYVNLTVSLLSIYFLSLSTSLHHLIFPLLPFSHYISVHALILSPILSFFHLPSLYPPIFPSLLLPSRPLTFLYLTGRRRWTRSSRTGWTSRIPRKAWRWWTSGTRRYCRTTGGWHMASPYNFDISWLIDGSFSYRHHHDNYWMDISRYSVMGLAWSSQNPWKVIKRHLS